MNQFSKCFSIFTKSYMKLIHYLEFRRLCSTSNKCISNKVYQAPWKILFLGTDAFALESLQLLYNTSKKKSLLSNLEIVTAYKGNENSIIKYAKKHNIQVHNWPVEIKEGQFDLGIVVSFGYLIPEKMIKSFPLGMINVHGSLLPKWRGAAPICYTLMNGDTITGISIMRIMPKRFDIGSIIAQKEMRVDPDDTYIKLHNKLSKLGAELLVNIVIQLPNVLNETKAQIEDEATYAPKITEKTSFIKWNEMNAVQIYNLQRALYGIHPLRTNFNNQVIKILNIKPVSENIIISNIRAKVPGLVIFNKQKKILYISCKGKSWITVETVIIPNRRPQSATDFGSGFILNRKEKSCIFY